MKKTILLMLSLIIGVSVFAQKDTMKVREVGLVFSNLNSFGLCYKTGNENMVFRITALSLTGTGTNSSYNQYSYNSVSDDSIASSPSSSFGVGLNFGFERRKHINKDFYFYYGLVLINSYSESQSNTTAPTASFQDYFNSSDVWTIQSVVLNTSTDVKTWSISSGIGVVIGVAYNLNRKFSIGAELIPSVSYNYAEAKTVTNSYFDILVPTGKGYEPNIYPNSATSDKITKGISYSVLNNNAAITIAYRIK